MSEPARSTDVVSGELIAEMLAGLEGVTPGPWACANSSYDEPDLSGPPWDIHIPGQGSVAYAYKERDGQHLTRCSPGNIRALLARISRAPIQAVAEWQVLGPDGHWLNEDEEIIERRREQGYQVRALYAHPLPQGEAAEDTLGYATRLLVSLMHKHCPDRSPQWEPLPDLMGVLTQLDNLSTCLARAHIQEHEFRADGVGVTGSDLCLDCGQERYEHDNRSTSTEAMAVKPLDWVERDVPADGWVWRIAGFKDGWFTDDAEKAERMRLDGVFVSAVSILSAPHSQPDELKRGRKDMVKITIGEEKLIALCRDAFIDGYACADGHATAPWETSETMADVKRLIDAAKAEQQMLADYREAGQEVKP